MPKASPSAPRAAPARRKTLPTRRSDSPVSKAPVQKVPAVKLEYAVDLDLFMRTPEPWMAEGIAAVPGFQRLWDREGPPLLRKAVELTGHPFEGKERYVSLSTSATTPGMSHPTLVGIGAYLPYRMAGSPLPTDTFSSFVFHELLHPYVDSLVGKAPTPLQRKYERESPLVQRHLHLMALQRAVYLALGQPDILAATVWRDSTYFGPDYARAWAIVNAEGHEPFMEELHPTR